MAKITFLGVGYQAELEKDIAPEHMPCMNALIYYYVRVSSHMYSKCGTMYVGIPMQLVLVLISIIYIKYIHLTYVLYICTIYNVYTPYIFTSIYVIPRVYTALLGGPYSVDDANRAPFPFDLAYLCPDMTQEDVKIKVSVYSVI